MQRCPNCKWGEFVQCPCCDSTFCTRCGIDEEDAERMLEEEEQ